MRATLFRIATRLLAGVLIFLGNRVVQTVLRQLPSAEAAYFLAQQDILKRLIRQAIKEPSPTPTAAAARENVVELAPDIVQALKSFMTVSKPDDIRAAGRRLSNLVFRLSDRVDVTATAAAEAVPESAPIVEKAPRYANAVLLEETGQQRLDVGSPLTPGSVVCLRLDIGELSDSQISQPTPFPEYKKDIDLHVMVTSTDFAVGSEPSVSEDAAVAYGRFFLPAGGGPATSPDGDVFLTFYLRAPLRAGLARCRIGYYYRNILLQSQRLSAAVGRRGGFKIETDFTLTEDLNNIDSIPERPRISILTNSNGNRTHQVVLRRYTTESTSGAQGATFEVNGQTVGATIRDLRKALRERAPTKKRRFRSELEEDLRRLAPHGWTLFTQLPAQQLDVWDTLFHDPDSFVVQVLRPTTSSFTFPWGLVYEIPLNSDKPTTCPLVTEWAQTQDLFTGSPRQCPHGPHSEDVLCPFGFWGFRYAIEQLPSSDKPVLSIPVQDMFDFVVAETQYDVDLKALSKHVDTLRSTLHRVSPNAQLREGKDKNSIKDLIGQDLPLVYFYCHGERQNIVDPNTWLGVGRRETITTKEVIGWVVSWQRMQKKRIWNEVRPLVFVNACHSLAIYPETLVSYLDALVGAARAAGVIGTEVKVAQNLAMDVAEQFFGLLFDGTHTVESALRAVRMDYLRNGNLLGLVYTPYCWAELRLALPQGR
jgi:hypothetical protein